MTDREFAAARALARCRFNPVTFAKRFARSVAELPPDADLSERQQQTLWQLVLKYRRQIKDETILAAARLELAALGSLSSPDVPPQQAATAIMLPPWSDPTPAAWLVYHDWLVDHRGGKLSERLRALRFAEGLKRRPRLYLYGFLPPERQDPGYAFTIFTPGQGEWKTATGLRWVTGRGLASKASPDEKAKAHDTAARCAATPLDFPGMADEPSPRAGHPLREFYYKASYDVIPYERDGSIYYRDRSNRQEVKIL